MMNKVIIITAPSGSGKTSLVKRMLKTFPELSFAVSACTRTPRKNEVDGKDYYFISVAKFKELINSNEFVEWEMVYEDKYYGTLVSEFKNIWNKEKSPIVDIDVSGALSIKEKYPEAITIYIKVPLKVLKHRLEARGTETEKSINERLKKAENEYKMESKFDFIVNNEDIDVASQNLFHIIKKYLKLTEKTIKF